MLKIHLSSKRTLFSAYKMDLENILKYAERKYKTVKAITDLKN